MTLNCPLISLVYTSISKTATCANPQKRLVIKPAPNQDKTYYGQTIIQIHQQPMCTHPCDVSIFPVTPAPWAPGSLHAWWPAQAPEKYGGHQTHGCTVSITVASSIRTFRVDVSWQECQARGTGADITTLRPQPGIPGFGDYWKCGRMQRSISGKPTQIVRGFSRKQN